MNLSSIWHCYLNIFYTTEPVDCGPLSNPANGQLSLNGTVFETIATYTCDSGFKLIGNDTRVCQSDGTWSESPTCESILKMNCLTVSVIVFHTYLYS